MKNNLLLGLSLALILSSVPSELLATEVQNITPTPAASTEAAGDSMLATNEQNPALAQAPVQQIAQDDIKGQLVNAYRKMADRSREEADRYNHDVDGYNYDADQLEQASSIADVINIFSSWFSEEDPIRSHLQGLLNPETRAVNAEWLSVALKNRAKGYYYYDYDYIGWAYYYLADAFGNISGHAQNPVQEGPASVPAAPAEEQAAPAEDQIEEVTIQEGPAPVPAAPPEAQIEEVVVQ